MGSQASETSIYAQHPYFFKDSEIYYPESDGEPVRKTPEIERFLLTADE